MKTNRLYAIIATVTVMMAAAGCNEDKLHPWGEGQLVGDLGKIADAVAEGTPGGAIIKYRLPVSQDLLYVKAIYTVGQGQRVEARASKYEHAVKLQGFGDTNPRDVELYCVDKMENVGEKVVVEVIPQKPAFQKVYENLNVGAANGGIYVMFDNEDRDNIAIHVETLNEMNAIYEPRVYYTNSAKGHFYVRGFESQSRPFGVYVTDRWGNRTETTTDYYTPMPEERLDKKKFSIYKLDDDIDCSAWSGSLAYAWNDDFTPALFVHSPGGDEFPMSFTFNMGQTAVLSRYTFYHLFMQQHAYQRGNLKTWEVWGRPDTPPQDGSWDGWTKLMDCESYKPSGLPVGEISGEDWEYLKEGEEFDFPPELPAVRYIRFKVLETWGGDDFIHFTEFTFYGNLV